MVSEGQWAAREGHHSHRPLAGFTPSNRVLIRRCLPVLICAGFSVVKDARPSGKGRVYKARGKLPKQDDCNRIVVLCLVT